MKFEQHFLDEIRQRLPISQVVGEHVIWDKRKSQPQRGDMWACCPFHGEKSPSFHADDRKGIYKCFGCGASGDHFKFLTEKVGYTFPLAVERLASMAGIPVPEEVRQESPEQRARREAKNKADQEEMNRRRARDDAERLRQREARVETAQEIWAQSVALSGSHGDAYLQARGLPPVASWPWDPVDTIRFNPSLPYELDRSAGNFPTIVARVQDCWSDTVAIWRVFLDRKSAAKAPVENAKVGLGPAKGGAVRIGGAGPKIGIGEGLETCLAAWALEGFRYPVWAGLSTSGMMAFEPPLEVKRVNIFPDGDAGKLHDGIIYDPPGMRAARDLRDRLNPTGIKTVINEICISGDVLDLLNTMRKHEERHPAV